MRLSGKTKILLAVAAVLLAATCAAGFYYLNTLKTQENTSAVLEDFKGKKREDVLSWISENGFDEQQVSFAYAFDEAEEDLIISQSIAKGESFTKNDVLEITLSSGPDPEEMIELPDFTGKSTDDITKWFEDNNLTNFSFSFTKTEDVEADHFVAMEPEAGTSVKRSDKVTVTISSGIGEQSEAEEITVPDFSSYTRTNIQAWGAANRISITVSYQSSDTVAKEKLISQSVKAGTKIKAGSSLSVVISSGKGISVVSFAGKTYNEASSWIAQNNLKAVYNEVYSEAMQAGNVISQNPSSGIVAEGAVITFEVSAGLVPVEDYTGRSRGEFEAYLALVNSQKNSSAKLNMSVRETESDKAAGTILSQNPTGNVAPGSVITIEVATGKKVTVESKSGMAEADFKAYLTSLGLKPGNISYDYSDTVSEGCIISNDTGTKNAGDSVNYKVSRGAYVFNYGSMINAGQSYNTLYNASAEARNYGWTVSRTDVESDTYDAGIIVENCSVSGKAIACRVSSGKVVAVPNVVGMSKEDAAAALQNAGLKANPVEGGYDDNLSAGTVTAQSTAADTRVAAGTTITITYSKGPSPKLTMPSIDLGLYDNNYTKDQMISMLTRVFEQKGFSSSQLNFQIEDTSLGSNVNGVKSISPAPNGQQVDPGTVVTIILLVGSTG